MQGVPSGALRRADAPCILTALSRRYTALEERTLERFRVGDVEVDRAAYLLTYDGQTREVEPRAMDVLCYLVEHRDRVVTNDELMEALWEGAVVTPNAVARVITQLRRALDDDARNPRYIKTLVRSGYRLIAPVDVDTAAPVAERGKAAAIGAVALVLLLVGVWALRSTGVDPEPSIAVLPFANMTGDDELIYLGEGVSEEVINALTRIPSLSVASRTASFGFRDSNQGLREIASSLNVVYVVEGSVRISGDRLRITAQLIDTTSGYHLWSNTEEYPVMNVFQAQDDISDQLYAVLSEELAIVVPQHAASKPPIGAAYDLYLQGRYLWHRRGNQPLQRAIDLFAEAVKVDPGFAQGWAALSSAYLTYPNYSPKGYETWNLAKPAAEKALALDPELSEPYAVLATFDEVAFNWSQARANYLRAIESAPNSPTANYWYAQHLTKVGLQKDALRYLARTLELDPTYLPPQGDIAYSAMAFGDLVGAGRQLQKVAALGFNSAANWGARMMWMVLTERYDDAIELIERELPPHMAQTEEVRQLLIAFVAAKREGAASAELIRQIEYAPMPHQFKLWMLNALQAYEELHAFAIYRIDQGYQLDLRNLMGPGVAFRKTPAFLEIAERLNLTAYWREHGFSDYCMAEADGVRCDVELTVEAFRQIWGEIES